MKKATETYKPGDEVEILADNLHHRFEIKSKVFLIKREKNSRVWIVKSKDGKLRNVLESDFKKVNPKKPVFNIILAIASISLLISLYVDYSDKAMYMIVAIGVIHIINFKYRQKTRASEKASKLFDAKTVNEAKSQQR